MNARGKAGGGPTGRAPTSADPIDVVLNALTRHGCDPRAAGAGKYDAKCPAHQGSRRNLSVSEGSDGAVLLRCHHVDDAGRNCPAAAIVSALGLELRDLFRQLPGSDRKAPPKAKRPPKTYDSPRDAAAALGRMMGVAPSGHWVYRVDGGAVAAVYRFDTPDGKQYRPVSLDPGTGLWVIKDPPGQWPLYRRDDLTAAPRVIFFEGEKCVDLARGLGLVASTTAHGSGSPHKTDLAPLAGKTVVIVPGHDAAGEGYATALVGLLAKLDPAPTVKVLRLPGQENEGDDLAEWVARRAGESAEALKAELERLADACPVEEPAGDDKPPDVIPIRQAGGGRRRFNLTDLGNAERLIARHGEDIRFCHPWNRWLVWDGRRWAIDKTGAARRRVRETVRSIYPEAAQEADEDLRKELVRWALTSERRDRIAAMLHVAEAEEGVPILPDAMDSNPWLFNCANGTIDLRTGKLRPHRRDDFLTKLCPIDFDPDARCPLFIETLDKFFHRADPKTKAELVRYWNRVCGYAMAGVIRDHALPVAYGTGSNGKSTILGALLDVFGCDYSMKCAPDLLMARKNENHPTDRADLFGMRLVVAIETEAGRRLNETIIKELTGGDRIRARRMREDFWEFSPTHTLIMATNHKPAVRGTDHGIWRRLKLVPFTVSVDDGQADKAMPEKLKAELPGILAWCVRGCLEWQKYGLDAPSEVVEATAEYRREQDLIGAFLDEHTVTGPNEKVKAGDLYRRYVEWAEAGNEYVVTMRTFGTAMQERGFESKRSDGIHYQGINVKPFVATNNRDRDERERGEF